MGKGTTVFYHSIYTSIEVLTDDITRLNAAMGAVIRYAVKNEEYTGDDPVVKCAMLQAIPLIEADRAKTNKGGHGAPKGNQNARKQTIGQDETNHRLEKNKPMVRKNKPMRGTETVDGDGGQETKTGDVNGATSSACDVASDITRQSKAEKQQKTLKAKEVVDYYNKQVLDKHSRMVSCERLTDKRKGHILARISEFGEEGVKRVIDSAIGSHFFEEVAKNSVANLDWLMLPTNFEKVIQGNFIDKPMQQYHNTVPSAHFANEGDRSKWANEKAKWEQ